MWCPSPHSAATAAPSSTLETRSLSRTLVSICLNFNIQLLNIFFCLTTTKALFLSIEIIEDVAESPAPPAQPVSVVSPPSQEKEAYKRLGLTKQVLAAHTQKEEQAFLTRCRELLNTRTFQKDCSTHVRKQKGPAIVEGTKGSRVAT